MICTTVREGIDCSFMTHRGCSFNGEQCCNIVEDCEGCKFVVEFPGGKYCQLYPDPASKWGMGTCNFASHVDREKVIKEHKLNPLKASKRARQG